MTRHETFGATPPFKARYGNFINGAFEAPKPALLRQISPITGRRFAKFRARQGRRRAALDARTRQGRMGSRQPREHATSSTPSRPDAGNLATLAAAKHGTMASDPRDDLATCRWPSIISAISPAACARRRLISEIDQTPWLSFSRAARRRRPDHSVELSAADGAWKLAPRSPPQLRVMKPAEQTPASILVWPRSSAISFPRACSTSSTALGSRPASRWRRRPHRQDRLQARRRRAADHAIRQPKLIR